jgi:transglutaminase-like putative cysteine protease
MAHPEGPPDRIQRLTTLAATVLVAVAVGFAFGRVFLGHGATYRLLAVGVASALVAWALERRSLVLATSVSAVALVVTIGLLVFPDTLRYGLPTLTTLRDLASAAGMVGEQARAQVSPAPTTVALFFAGITAVWAAVFSCHALAFRAGSPLLSLVPPLGLVVFADSVLDEFSKPGYGILFLIAALAVLFADGIRRVQGWGPVWSGPGRRARLLPMTGRSARRVSAVVLGVALLAPAVLPGFGSHAVIDITHLLGTDDRVGVSPLVRLSSELTSGEVKDLFEVTSTEPTYWRTTALERYDGDTWWPTTVDSRPVQSGQPLAFAEVGGTSIVQRFTALQGFSSVEIPVAAEPLAVDLEDSNLRWEPVSGTVSLDKGLDEGQTYRVNSVFPDPSAKQLATATVTADPALVQLPQNMPPEIAQIAEAWTAGASTTYDKVLAVADHLRSIDSGFEYSLAVEYGTDPNALVRFLTSAKKGFCQQFASAMAVLLRTLGIPTRLADGYTTGREVEGQADTYLVTTKNYHVWVEVRFDEYGWLAFDATPGLTNAAATTYQPPPDGGGGSRSEECTVSRGRCNSGSVSVTPSTSVSRSLRGSTGGATISDRRAGWFPLLTIAVILLLLLVLSAAPLLFAWRRARRVRHATDPRTLILATYDVFTERAAALGLARPPGDTPEEYRRRVEGSGRLTDGHVDRLTRLAVLAAYAPVSLSEDDAQDATADADEAIRELRATTPWKKRVLGMYGRRW